MKPEKEKLADLPISIEFGKTPSNHIFFRFPENFDLTSFRFQKTNSSGSVDPTSRWFANPLL
jgi:hypothetical protein